MQAALCIVAMSRPLLGQEVAVDARGRVSSLADLRQQAAPDPGVPDAEDPRGEELPVNANFQDELQPEQPRAEPASPASGATMRGTERVGTPELPEPATAADGSVAAPTITAAHEDGTSLGTEGADEDLPWLQSDVVHSDPVVEPTTDEQGMPGQEPVLDAAVTTDPAASPPEPVAPPPATASSPPPTASSPDPPLDEAAEQAAAEQAKTEEAAKATNQHALESARRTLDEAEKAVQARQAEVAAATANRKAAQDSVYAAEEYLAKIKGAADQVKTVEEDAVKAKQSLSAVSAVSG